MSFAYVKSGSGVLQFVQSNAYTLGQRMVPKRSDVAGNALIGKRYVWEVTTAGTSAGAEPTWPASVTINTTTLTSNTAVFTARRPGFNSSSVADWAYATPFLDFLGLLMVAGDTAYISHQHAENSTNIVWGGAGMVSGVNYLCVNDGATPPTALATTATVTTTGAFNITVGTANSYTYGITFICGATDTGTRILTALGINDSCSFQQASTGAASSISCAAVWKNCTVKFAAAGQAMNAGTGLGAPFSWQGGSLLAGGTSPTTLIAAGINALVEDLDLSNASAGINLASIGAAGGGILFRRIKLPTSWSGAVNSSAIIQGGGYTEAHSFDNAGTNYQYRRKTAGGETFSETTIVRTGGASDGVTALSHKLVASSLALFPATHASTPEISRKNTVTGTPITVTVELVHDSVTALKDNEIYLEVHYFSASGSPLGAMISSAAGLLAAGSSLTSSSETWTTTGMSNPNKRKMSVTFTPQLKGYISARVFLCKASTTAYVCPKLTVT